jgi:hypothetical protein
MVKYEPTWHSLCYYYRKNEKEDPRYYWAGNEDDKDTAGVILFEVIRDERNPYYFYQTDDYPYTTGKDIIGKGVDGWIADIKLCIEKWQEQNKGVELKDLMHRKLDYDFYECEGDGVVHYKKCKKRSNSIKTILGLMIGWKDFHPEVEEFLLKKLSFCYSMNGEYPEDPYVDTIAYKAEAMESEGTWVEDKYDERKWLDKKITYNEGNHLFMAVMFGNKYWVEKLLEHGASIKKCYGYFFREAFLTKVLNDGEIYRGKKCATDKGYADLGLGRDGRPEYGILKHESCGKKSYINSINFLPDRRDKIFKFYSPMQLNDYFSKRYELSNGEYAEAKDDDKLLINKLMFQFGDLDYVTGKKVKNLRKFEMQTKKRVTIESVKLEKTFKERNEALILSKREDDRKETRKEIATLLNDANEKEQKLYKNRYSKRHQCGLAPGNDKPAKFSGEPIHVVKLKF